MSKRSWGMVVPLLVSGLVVVAVLAVSPRPPIANAIYAGLIIALLQSFASTASLRWALEKKAFYWVWGAGMLGRMAVFGITAFVVHQFTDLNFVATLTTLVSATMLFLVVESATILKN